MIKLNIKHISSLVIKYAVSMDRLGRPAVLVVVPDAYVPVSVQHQRCSASLIMEIEMGNIFGAKEDDISWAQGYNEPILLEAQLSTAEHAQGHNTALPIVAPVPMKARDAIDVDSQAGKWIEWGAAVVGQGGYCHLELVDALRIIVGQLQVT